MALRIAAIVPMKPVGQAKSRLAPRLPDQQRQVLALLLLCRVLQATQGCASLATTWVVGGDGPVRVLAAQAGARWQDDAGADLNFSLRHAFDQWFSQGGDAALFVPADLPFLRADELERLVRASGGGRSLVLSPAKRDGGTNALLVPRDCRLPFRLGEQSFLHHLQEASRLHYPVACYFSQSLGLDLDTVEDMRRCLDTYPQMLEDADTMKGYLGPATRSPKTSARIPA